MGAKSLHLAPQLSPGAPIQEQARAVARALMALMPQADRDAAFHRQLQVYIQTDPELRALQNAQYEALFEAIGDQLQTAFGDSLAMPARSVALAVQALVWGFMHQWSQTPDAVTEEVIAQGFEALAIGATTEQPPS